MNVSKIFNLIVLSFAGILFAAQPPMPPKPPAINKAAAIVQGLQLPPSWKPTLPRLVHFESKSKNGAKVIYRGILATNAQGNGRLACKITYDAQHDTYSGEVINDQYTQSEWFSQSLEINEAKEFYLDMVKQDPDQKGKLG